MKKFLVFAFVLAVSAIAVDSASAACGGRLFSGLGRVLGVQRRQERRAEGNGVFQGRRVNGRLAKGSCANGVCTP